MKLLWLHLVDLEELTATVYVCYTIILTYVGLCLRFFNLVLLKMLLVRWYESNQKYSIVLPNFLISYFEVGIVNY